MRRHPIQRELFKAHQDARRVFRGRHRMRRYGRLRLISDACRHGECDQCLISNNLCKCECHHPK